MMVKPARFAEVPVGGWFKETVEGAWHLKMSSAAGMYQRWGTRYEPRYGLDDLVWVRE